MKNALTKSDIETGLTKIGVTKPDCISTEEFRMLVEQFGRTDPNTISQVPHLRPNTTSDTRYVFGNPHDGFAVLIAGEDIPSQFHAVPWTQLGSVSRWPKWTPLQAIYSLKRGEREVVYATEKLYH